MDDLTDRSFEELFGEVRSIVHGAPSPDAYMRLIEAVDDHPLWVPFAMIPPRFVLRWFSCFSPRTSSTGLNWT